MLQVTVRTKEIPSPQSIVSRSPATTPPPQLIPQQSAQQQLQSPVIIPPQTLNVTSSSSPMHSQMIVQQQYESPSTPQHSGQSILMDVNVHKTPQTNILLDSPVQVGLKTFKNIPIINFD